MSRINEIIASMPPGEAAAVVHLRDGSFLPDGTRHKES